MHINAHTPPLFDKAEVRMQVFVVDPVLGKCLSQLAVEVCVRFHASVMKQLNAPKLVILDPIRFQEARSFYSLIRGRAPQHFLASHFSRHEVPSTPVE